MNLCVHGKPRNRPDLCLKCWELAWALGLVDTRERPAVTAGADRATEDGP